MNTGDFEVPASGFGGEGSPSPSARRVAELLGVNLTELAGLIGVTRSTLAAKAGARKVGAALGPVVRILSMAGEMADNEQRAAIWFKHRPIPGWAGKTAYDLVREGKTDKVLAYLGAVRSGIYA
ncbi:antitoxin Xre/MbcA/ParS toxin-binding domain-containing protein [Mesorhizobium helmanticense]|uniref:Transcriptional regulator n=1 Tax=Mesorhizobium helmanticense TaxID=1776423 RepID=A0A2T4IV45_9HYPH|nr:antitoxin Xre/MbcA/ParS toxin-binding domain-containing protein [Mesorhizobium helmanticense]PTE09531.1 transcriptional regulator [Mesorhizobium helmanticense]